MRQVLLQIWRWSPIPLLLALILLGFYHLEEKMKWQEDLVSCDFQLTELERSCRADDEGSEELDGEGIMP